MNAKTEQNNQFTEIRDNVHCAKFIAAQKMGGKPRLGSVFHPTRRYPWVLHPLWLSISPDFSLPLDTKVLPTCCHAQPSIAAAGEAVQIKGHWTTSCVWQSPKAGLTGGSGSCIFIATQPNGLSSCSRLCFQLLKIKAGSGPFHCPDTLLQKSVGPNTAAFAIPESALLELAITTLFVSKWSSLKVRVDKPVGQSHLQWPLSALLYCRIGSLTPCAQMGWESRGWISVHKTPDNAVQQEPFFAVFQLCLRLRQHGCILHPRFHSKTFCAMAIRNKQAEQAPESYREEKKQTTH